MGGNQPIHPQVSGSRTTPLEVTEKAGRGAFPLRAINHLRPACPGHARRRHRTPRPSHRRPAANRKREFGVRPGIPDAADRSAADPRRPGPRDTRRHVLRGRPDAPRDRRILAPRPMRLDLTDEEATVLLRLLNRAIEDDRYPLSPRIRTLRTS